MVPAPRSPAIQARRHMHNSHAWTGPLPLVLSSAQGPHQQDAHNQDMGTVRMGVNRPLDCLKGPVQTRMGQPVVPSHDIWALRLDRMTGVPGPWPRWAHVHPSPRNTRTEGCVSGLYRRVAASKGGCPCKRGSCVGVGAAAKLVASKPPHPNQPQPQISLVLEGEKS